mgnify:CR=1 FL=1
MTTQADMAQDPFAGERLKLSHFHSRQAALNLRDAWSSGTGSEFAGDSYGAEDEDCGSRSACGTYDLCARQT